PHRMASANQRIRILYQLAQGLEEGCSHSAIDHPVITGHGHGHYGAEFHTTGLLLKALPAHCTYRENTALGGIDHRIELTNTEHAQVGYSEGAAGQLLGLEPTDPGFLREFCPLTGQCMHPFLVGIT